MILSYVKICFTGWVRYDSAQLETLLAIAEEGSFEAAARALHLTPSAVSQRVRALERLAGQVLVRRTAPAAVTEAGEPLLRLGRQMRLLITEAAAELGTPNVVELPVAVNADSLSTWFRPVLAEVARRPGTALRLHVEDESHSHALLRGGEVLAAVTTQPIAVQGCSVRPLGALRYLPVAAPDLLAEHRRGRGVSWSTIPLVEFNDKDRLQQDVLTAHGAERPPVVHRVPGPADFLAALRCGLGWGMVPEPHVASALAGGELIRLPGAKAVDAHLHWQRWRLQSPALEALSAAVLMAASATLRTSRHAPVG